jgi:hypothetical protein
MRFLRDDTNSTSNGKVAATVGADLCVCPFPGRTCRCAPYQRHVTSLNAKWYHPWYSYKHETPSYSERFDWCSGRLRASPISNIEKQIPPCRNKRQDGILNSWCRGAESNHRHKDFQSSALPAELPRLQWQSIIYREGHFCQRISGLSRSSFHLRVFDEGKGLLLSAVSLFSGSRGRRCAGPYSATCGMYASV